MIDWNPHKIQKFELNPLNIFTMSPLHILNNILLIFVCFFTYFLILFFFASWSDSDSGNNKDKFKNIVVESVFGPTSKS